MSTSLTNAYLSLSDLVEPLLTRLSGPETIEWLFSRCGWNVTLDDSAFAQLDGRLAVRQPIVQLVTAASAVRQTLGDGSGAPSVQEVVALTDAAAAVIDAVAHFSPTDLSGLAEPLGDPHAWEDLGQALLSDLLEEYLRFHQPALFALLHFWGVLRYEAVEPEGTFRRRHMKVTFDWRQLVALVREPLPALKRTYKWGDTAAPFEYEAFLDAFAKVLSALHVPTERFLPGVVRPLSGDPTPDFQVHQDVAGLRATFLADVGIRDAVFYEVGLDLMPAGRLGESVPSGLMLKPVLRGGAEGTVALGGGFAMNWKVGAAGDDLVGLAITPEKIDLTHGELAAGASLEVARTNEEPWYLLGSAGTSRIEVNSPSLRVSIEGSESDAEARLHLSATGQNGQPGCKVVVQLGDADGFVKGTVKQDGFELALSPEVIWSTKTGLTFNGNAKLDIDIPLNLSLGALQIKHVIIRLAPKDDSDDAVIEVEASVGLAFELGPIQGSLERIGLLLTADFARQDKNLGFVDLSFGFKPPSGVGLAIDVAGIVGGGFIEHDPAKHQYAGMVQLGFYSYKLLAFGLLTTVLPTGPGYSLVVMVDAEFPPIQLGFGFTLAGAGGMLGIHRTASIDALRAALAAHTLSNLLFPKHPIENAPQLLTELDTLFPAADGRFVFGPLARIAWGSPPLLTLDLALILELPAPVRLILISELTVVLPKPDAVLVEIHLTALGTIDFGKGEAGLDAVLHDSRLVKFVLHGAMALRVCWSGQKTFLLAVGGTHPKFQLPPGFPKLDRLGISLASGSVAKFNLDGYMAITSNTLQIGAHVDLFVGIDGFAVSGVLTFDTLIQRHPFHFDGDISGAVTLSVAGSDVMVLKLAASLTGPAPWHAAGSVTFDVLWWSVTKSFSKTFGDPGIAELLDAIDVGQLLRDALGDPRSFAAALAADVSALVTLAAPATPATMFLAHPGAGLSVHQTVVPLGLTITQYGGAVPAGETLFNITGVSAGGNERPSPAPVLDDFAPAQFLTLSDDERLASPSFERLAAGVEIAGDTIFGAAGPSGAAIVCPITYETFFVDTRDGLPRQEEEPSTPLPHDRLTALLFDGAAGRSALARTGSQRYVGPRRATMPAELDFVVATSEQLASSGVGAAVSQSYSQARAALDAELARHPERRGELLIAPRYEVQS